MNNIIEILSIYMGAEIKLLLTTVVGAIIGILEATGHLDASTGNQFQNDLAATGGTVLSLISIVVLFYHQIMILENDLKHVDWGSDAQKTVTTSTNTPPAA